MIILDDKCTGVENILIEYLNSTEKKGYEGSLSDFDDAVITVTINGDNVTVAVDWGCASILLENGGKAAVEAAYKGQKVAFTKTSASVSFPLSAIPAGGADRTAFLANIARIKYHVFSGPFLKIIDGSLTTPLQLTVRSSEFIWIIPKPDKSFMCGFSHAVSDRTDLPIAQVLYHEFNDVRKDSALSACPSVQSSAATETVPVDIANNFPSVSKKGIDGYFLFTVLDRHYKGPALTQKVIGQMLVFRAYVNYHFKCSKAFTHYRMMVTCKEWIQVLNRAKPERARVAGTRTITGKKIIEKKF